MSQGMGRSCGRRGTGFLGCKARPLSAFQDGPRRGVDLLGRFGTARTGSQVWRLRDARYAREGHACRAAGCDTARAPFGWACAAALVHSMAFLEGPLIAQVAEPGTELDLESLFAFGLERLLDSLTIVVTPRENRR